MSGYRDDDDLKPTLLELVEAKSLFALGLLAIILLILGVSLVVG